VGYGANNCAQGPARDGPRVMRRREEALAAEGGHRARRDSTRRSKACGRGGWISSRCGNGLEVSMWVAAFCTFVQPVRLRRGSHDDDGANAGSYASSRRAVDRQQTRHLPETVISGRRIRRWSRPSASRWRDMVIVGDPAGVLVIAAAPSGSPTAGRG